MEYEKMDWSSSIISRVLTTGEKSPTGSMLSSIVIGKFKEIPQLLGSTQQPFQVESGALNGYSSIMQKGSLIFSL